jgi:hypothetical protein
MSLIKYVQRAWSKFSTRGTEGLTKAGDWYILYSDGRRTYYLSYGDVKMLQELYGGEIKWRYE